MRFDIRKQQRCSEKARQLLTSDAACCSAPSAGRYLRRSDSSRAAGSDQNGNESKSEEQDHS